MKNVYDQANQIALNLLSAKWGVNTAKDELKNSVTKIKTIQMGSSKVFSFDIYLPSGRVHSFEVCGNKTKHKVFN